MLQQELTYEQRQDYKKNKDFVKLCKLLNVEDKIKTDYFDNVEWHFKANNIYKIIGVCNDELVLLESVSTGINHKPQAHIITMRKISQETIDAIKEDIYSSEDIWKECVRSGNTILGLQEFHEEAVAEAESQNLLYPYDDDSFREETLNALRELSKEDKKKLEKVFGVIGEDYANLECGSICSLKSLLEDNTEFDLILNEEIYNILLNENEGN